MLVTLDEVEKGPTFHKNHEIGPFSVFTMSHATSASGRKESRDTEFANIAAETAMRFVNSSCSVPVALDEDGSLEMGFELSDKSFKGDIEVLVQDSTCSLEGPTLSSPIPLEFMTNLFSDKVTRELMYNYVNIVADLLQPASHFRNPYKSIYVPNALIGSAESLTGVGLLEPSHSNVAVFHAILSVSAFNLRGTEALPDRVVYDNLGRLHRCKAFKHLQKALLDELDREDYHAVMSAMMCLVSSDVSYLVGARIFQLTVCVADGWRYDRVLDSPRRMSEASTLDPR